MMNIHQTEWDCSVVMNIQETARGIRNGHRQTSKTSSYKTNQNMKETMVIYNIILTKKIANFIPLYKAQDQAMMMQQLIL